MPIESQALVFSQTSLQGSLINMHNPRAVFFNDRVSVGWVRGGKLLEVAAVDPRQGVIFYALDQQRSSSPRFTRDNQCLSCHLSPSWDTLGVPGLLLMSMNPLPDDPNAYASGFTTVHGSPLEQRWGGWWVTGDPGGVPHMGNVPVLSADNKRRIASPTRPLKSVEGLFDLAGYPTPYSDVVAQMVLAHQARMTNLITRIGWEARLAARNPSSDATSRVREAAQDLVDYLLFVDEAPLPRPVRGTSGFAEMFAAARAARWPGSVAARPRPAAPAVPASVQLPDLLRGLRRVTAPGEGCCLCPPADRPVGRRSGAAVSCVDRRRSPGRE